MRYAKLRFGSIEIDGFDYSHDVVIDRGKVIKRKKKLSKKYREQFGHTPLSIDEKIPWKCKQLVVGTGNHGSLPVMDDVKDEARRRKVDLLLMPTARAIDVLARNPKDTNAILHLTC